MHASFNRTLSLSRAALITIVLALSACTTPAPRPIPVIDINTGNGVAATTIAEAFTSEVALNAEVDSLATWLTPEGQTWVIATAKKRGTLLVYDGETGALIREVVKDAPIARPNGIATFGDYVFVISRDNANVLIFSLPDFELLHTFGDGQLQLPYGLWVNESAPGVIETFVTDSYQVDDETPALGLLNQRIKRFRVRLYEEPIQTDLVDSFGSIKPEGALRRVESIVGDVAFNRVVIAEEHPDFRHRGPLIYTMQGKFTGKHLGEGLFQGDPEGIALYECPSGNGYWIATDQDSSNNRFHLFDRSSLAYLGSFSGNHVHSTDGISLYSGSSDRFPYGALYVSHDDVGIAAFDWRDIASALNLWLDCPE